MSKERKLIIAKLTLDAACVKDIFVSVTVGNDIDTGVFIHDLRDKHNPGCWFYFVNGYPVQSNDIKYIFDPDFSQAEEHLKRIIKEGNHVYR